MMMLMTVLPMMPVRMRVPVPSPRFIYPTPAGPLKSTARATLVLVLLAGSARPPEPDPRMISELMRMMYGAIRAERLSPEDFRALHAKLAP